MSWSKSKPPVAQSTISQVLPLIITLVFLGGMAWVGYQIYLSAVKVQAQASKQMGSKNVVFTKDGVRVGVRHVENERYVDATQSWVVKAWNLSGGGGGGGGDNGKRQSPSISKTK